MVDSMNRGAEILSRRFAERGAQSQLAKTTGIDQGYLSKIANGERCPGLSVRRTLERELGIPMQLWDEPAAESGPLPRAADQERETPTGTDR
jgi:transcriptional regulator with XRE-family HTH domain